MILTIIVSALLSIFIFIAATLAIKVLILQNDLAESKLRTALLEQGVKDALKNEPPIENSEGFLRFLSESRDWAFQYIEEVQARIGQFINEVDPLINHFDEFGDVLSTNRPDYNSMKIISKSYKKLKELLPENNGSQ